MTISRLVRLRASRGLCLGIAGLAAATLAASPASAQEDTFTGFRIGGILGWDNSGVNFDNDVFEEGRTSQNGFFYGADLGYDFQWGDIVGGIEAEISDSTAGKEEILTGIREDGVAITADTNVDMGGDFYIGVRGGGVVMPNLLLYAKAGYTHATIDIDGDGTADGVPFTFDDGISMDGFRIGAGAEYVFSGGFYGKAEYRYSNYNNGELNIEGDDVELDTAFDAIDFDRHQFVLGVGLRF